MKITIYQINQEKDINKVKFMDLEMTQEITGSESIDLSIYQEVFSGEVDCVDLEDVFSLFNSSQRPEGFTGHSLSVSDLVETESGFSFVDSFGFFDVEIKEEEEDQTPESPISSEPHTTPAIEKALTEGFVLTEVGYGSYLEREQSFRDQNLMVVSWYVPSDKDEKKYQLYTREKKTRGQSKEKLVPMPGIEKLEELKKESSPDYESMTVKELREICKSQSIKGYSKLSKQAIINELQKVG